MFTLLANAGSALSLFADAPSTFTLGLIGGACLIAYEYCRRKPNAVQTGTLSLVQPVAEEATTSPEVEHRLAA